jgi:IS30 family transposase
LRFHDLFGLAQPAIVTCFSRETVGDLAGASLVKVVPVPSVIARVPAKTAQHVSDAILSLLTPFSDCVHTLTTDKGKEFAQHERIAKQLDAGFFFAHPYEMTEKPFANAMI